MSDFLRHFEQIECPCPEPGKEDIEITGLDERASIKIPAQFLKALVAIAVTPPDKPLIPRPDGDCLLPTGTRIVGTGFRTKPHGAFVTAAHLFSEADFPLLFEQRRLAAVCLVPGSLAVALPILALSFDRERDLAVGKLPYPAAPAQRHVIGDVPFSFEPPTDGFSGIILVAGFQDTHRKFDGIRLWPIIFRGEGFLLSAGPHCFEADGRIVSVHETLISVPIKARPGLNGAPLLMPEGPLPGKQYTGVAQGVQLFVHEPDPEESVARFMPVHHVLNVVLDHAGFEADRGKTFNDFRAE